jgi:hypothetical protein
MLVKERRLDLEMYPEVMNSLFEKTFIPWIEIWPQDFGTENNHRDRNWTPFRIRINENWKHATSELLGWE